MWNDLNMTQRNELIKLYLNNGISSLDEMKEHYNTFQAGGPIKKESNYSVGRVLDGIYRAVNHEEFMGEPSHKYQFIKPEYVGLSEEELDSLVGQADERGHRLDVVKAEAHPSHYSRGTWNGNDFELTDKGLAEVNHTYFGLNDGGQDPQARLTYKGSTVLPEITITPDGAYIYNTYDNIKLHLKQQGGYLGKVTPLGQWQYPHQVTTIPSHNITMKGVDYPVIGVSNTGDTKYMLPNMDYLFEGNYVTEYPLHKFQRGGNTDGISSGRWVQVDDETVTPEYSLPPVTVEAEHPLWSLPWYKDKKNNPNINRYKDQLYNNWRRHNEAGKKYLKRVAGGLSVTALPIGGVAGFVLGVPDLATDFAEMTDKPSVSNATELTLDAPTRYGTELDNALISVLESNRYTKPLAKILQYNDALQYIGAANDASSAITGKSIIEHAKK